jgi:hypothetical protein
MSEGNAASANTGGASEAPDAANEPQAANEPVRGPKNGATGPQKPGTAQMEAAVEAMEELVINGKATRFSKEQIRRLAQKGAAADDVFRQVHEEKQRLASLMKIVKENPAKVLRELGIDPRQFSEQELVRAMKEEALSPEERRISELEAKLAEREGKDKEREEQVKAERMEKLTAQAHEQTQKQIVDALRPSGLPATPETIKRVAYHMHHHVELGIPFDMSDIVDKVRADYLKEHGSVLSSMDPEKLFELFPDLAKKLQKADIARLKRTGEMPEAANEPSGKPAPKQKYKDVYAWREAIRKRSES